MLVGTLVEVGRGRLSPLEVEDCGGGDASSVGESVVTLVEQWEDIRDLVGLTAQKMGEYMTMCTLALGFCVSMLMQIPWSFEKLQGPEADRDPRADSPDE